MGRERVRYYDAASLTGDQRKSVQGPPGEGLQGRNTLNVNTCTKSSEILPRVRATCEGRLGRGWTICDGRCGSGESTMLP